MKRLNVLVCLAALSAIVGSTHLYADATGRAVMTSEPPREPHNLFQMPTGSVVNSMDMEVSGRGVLFTDDGKPAILAVLGLGDIAQMEVGGLAIATSMQKKNKLTAVPSAGLKVHMPLGRFGRGVAASFQRSGSHTDVVDVVNWDARVGEFHTVATFANHAADEVESMRAGWNGVKIQTHLGAKYVDARLKSEDGFGATERQGNFWRPIAGFEVWRDDARARVIAELNWITGFDDANGGSIEVIRVINGGVRFFFSKHVTFDIGFRQQSNDDGIAESALQTKATFHLPIHSLRDRVVGN